MGFLLDLAINIAQRTRWEALLIPPPDRTKELQELREIVEKNQARTPVPQKQESPAEALVLNNPLEVPRGPLTTDQTVAYHNREIGKLLLRMERHYAQKLRINGIPCDCGASKHLLDIEALVEETIPMVDSPQIYYRLIEWVRAVGPKSTEEAAKSGKYDEEYPAMSHQARDFRKEVLGTLDTAAMFPQNPGEPEGTRIVPVLSESEKQQVKEAAHRRIEEVLA